MAAIDVQIAEALVSELNAQTFSQVFTATRAYRPRVDLKDLDALAVTIVPASLDITISSRASAEHLYRFDIALQDKLSSETNATIDPYRELAEEIFEHLKFRNLSLAGGLTALWSGIANDPVFAPEHLDTMRVFTSIIRASYRLIG